jgi:hypothetical protein
MEVPTVLIVPLAERLNAWSEPQSSAAWLHAAPKLVPNMERHGDGTQKHARNGTR